MIEKKNSKLLCANLLIFDPMYPIYLKMGYPYYNLFNTKTF